MLNRSEVAFYSAACLVIGGVIALIIGANLSVAAGITFFAGIICVAVVFLIASAADYSA